MRVVASIKSIPEYFVFARGKRLVVERPRNDIANGILYDNGDIRRLVELELDRLEAGFYLDCLERTPVNSGKSVLHHNRKRPSIGKAKRLRRTALFDKLCKPPYVGAHERHHAVRLDAFAEELLCRKPLVTVRAVVWLESEQHPVARIRAIRACADKRPRYRNFLDVATGDFSKRLLHAFRHHILALRLRGKGESCACGGRGVAVAPELEVRELQRQQCCDEVR